MITWFLIGVRQDNIKAAKDCGFVKYENEEGNDIWHIDYFMLSKENPLYNVDAETQRRWIQHHIAPCEMYECNTSMWDDGRFNSNKPAF